MDTIFQVTNGNTVTLKPIFEAKPADAHHKAFAKVEMQKTPFLRALKTFLIVA